jgi:nucleoside-diphosphate-sugar epimerase
MGQIYQAIKPKEVIETFGIKNFVETGTGIADSLSYILNVRPDDLNVYTIELMDELHSKLVEKFEGTPNLHLIKGYSHVEMKNILGGRNSNNDVVRRELGWDYSQSLEEGILKTYEWISEQINAKKV